MKQEPRTAKSRFSTLKTPTRIFTETLKWCEQILFRVRGEDPESIVLAAERLHAQSLGNVPHANRPVLRVTHDQLVPGIIEKKKMKI